MKRVFVFMLLLLIGTAGFGSIVFAHLTGVSYEETKDGYKIDIGHDQFVSADQPSRFDFLLYPLDSTSSTAISTSTQGDPFTDVWATITQDKKLFFAGGIAKPSFGSTGFTYVFPKEGTYTISARYEKDGDTVVTTEFPLQVLKSTDAGQGINPVILYVLLSLAGLIIGMAVGLFIPRQSSKQQKETKNNKEH